MKNSHIERKKYSVHNLVKLINERNKQNVRKDSSIVESGCLTSIQVGKGLNMEQNVTFLHEGQNMHVKRNNKNKINIISRKNIQEGDINGSHNGENEDVLVSEKEFDGENLLNEDILEEQHQICNHDQSVILDVDEEKRNANEIKLFMFDYNECHNKKCSCKKLYRFKKIKKAQINKKFKGIVLTPFCEKYFSINDKKIVENFGLSVIDCSWKSLDLLKKTKFTNQRKLPYIIAVNSINYGKPYKLSCLESLAFCLYLCNYNKQCNDILNIYKWSSNFTTLNRDLLDMYKLCNNHEEVKNAENEFIQKFLNEKEQEKKIDQYKVIYEDGYL
ncbi:ribosome biogenesis protein TSR3 [Plasmodium gonderi]|uniref:18S rRNA aminocarboxypropyltransferase n=1 Tax=Plasmodium gonderi TaxID=77519 RepID=A0A1Y1JRY2_PLAGO|nr:ribosome biogenesis protein TSR3 [Plasmodium gonderi]GAW83582.1 ribosome biogenesis protein TSR3 [Plasmodium gonderi]